MDLLIRQLHSLRCTLIELAFESDSEKRGDRENVLVRSEYTAIRSHHQGDNGTGQCTAKEIYQPSYRRRYI